MDDATKELIKKLSPEERTELLTEMGFDPAKLMKDADIMKAFDALVKRVDAMEGKKPDKKKTSLLDEMISTFTGKR